MGVSVEVRPAGGRKLREGDWGLGDVLVKFKSIGKFCPPFTSPAVISWRQDFPILLNLASRSWSIPFALGVVVV